MNSNIYGYQRFSAVDYPAKPGPVIFLGGCNFRCPTCHNLNIVDKKTDLIDFDFIYNDILTYKKYIHGITITGGEPLLNNSVIDLVDSLSKLNIPIKLDTNGSNPDLIEELLPLIDLFAIDIKGPWYLYAVLTGFKIKEEEIKRCFKQIFKIAIKDINREKFYFRTTVVPTLTESNIEIIKMYLQDNHYLHLQEYIPVNKD